ncbi:periplasmic beta-glucosidase, partial [Elysia marginata]
GPDTKIVLLLFSAGPLNVTFADESARVSAILECFFPGQGTGEALVNVLFNKDSNSSPAGRLPMTWPKFAWQVPSMVNYSMAGRTYRYLNTDPLYPFGYGLSYTRFNYTRMMVKTVHNATKDLDLDLTLQNIGPVDADEVIQCYVEPKYRQPYPAPRRALAYFGRIHIQAGLYRTLWITLSKQAWSVWKDGQWTYITLPSVPQVGTQPWALLNPPSSGIQPNCRSDQGTVLLSVESGGFLID